MSDWYIKRIAIYNESSKKHIESTKTFGVIFATTP